MISKENIKALILALGFRKENSFYKKEYNKKTLEIDSDKETIAYAEFGIKVGDKTTSNFASDENFVVLECVDKLLTKGYEPKHIELEPKWKLGHGASGGKADILVRDKNFEPLLIIECKTYGKAFEKELDNMQKDGGQLFSYFHQERATKYLCLYASRLNQKKLEYQNKIIKTSKEYDEAKNVNELFQVWNTFYLKSFADNGIFEEEIQAYNISLQAKKRKDLKPLPQDNKIFNKFMEILRHHNISEKERAFNKIISLFLCKIVDETKTANEELSFQYKNGIDDIYSMQDKLLNLFHIGMKDYLKEEITYIKESEIEEDFKFYSKKTALIAILKKFREQKYHSNNEFTFLDVNNKALFAKNAQVLKEVIELFEPYQFSYTHKEQILGNFFENLLSKGFKQSEGQFFTPVPIAKFIMMSLPIENMIKQKQERGETYPLPFVMDYACGSAHFLTEAIDEISYVIKDLVLNEYAQDTKWAKRHIFGIEKDYRLSRTAKVACFLNGAGESNIIYGDGLEKHENVIDGTFDIIVANPPYSVKEFKNFTTANSQSFSLFDALTSSSKEIEVLFIERTAQLLRVGGYGAIILPSSILSTGGIYAKARKLLLENFYIKAIAEFGSNTFGATGTNTVTLFLEKRDNQDQKYFKESAKLLFEHTNKKANDRYSDDNYLSYYCESIEVAKSDYRTLLTNTPSPKLKETEFYKDYQNGFEGLNEIKNLKKQKDFNKLSSQEKETKLNKLLLINIKENEQEKFLYFSLCQEQKITLVKTGDKKAEKAFLGYKWSTAKGNEGIQFYNETSLYDDENKNNLEKANTYIKNALLDKEMSISENLIENVFKHKLIDLIDFKKIDFEAGISLAPKKEIKIVGKPEWQRKLGDVVDVLIGGTPARANFEYFNGTNLWVSISEMKGTIINDTKEKISEEGIKKSNVKLIPKGTTLLSFKLSIGKTAIAGKDLYTNEAIAGLIPKNNEIRNDYLFHLFNGRIIDLEKDNFNTFGKSLNSAFLKNEVIIPLPPLNIQEEIVKACQKVDDEVEEANGVIRENKQKIEDKISSVRGDMVRLGDLHKTSSGGTPLSTKQESRFNCRNTVGRRGKR